LFTRTSVNNEQLFRDLMVLFTMVMQGKMAGCGAEEVRKAASEAMRRLLTTPDESLETKVGPRTRDSQEYQLLYSHAIFVALEAVDRGQDLDYRLVVLSLLETLLRSLKGDMVLTVLPGVSSSLCKGILKDSKENHRFIVRSLELLTFLLTLTVTDELNEAILPKIASDLSQLAALSLDGNKEEDVTHLEVSSESRKSNMPPVRRDAPWLKMVSERLSSLLRQISLLMDHPAWRVRLAMAGLAFTLLSRCPRSLRSSVHHMAEVLVFYCSDVSQDVSAFAFSSLKVRILLFVCVPLSPDLKISFFLSFKSQGAFKSP